MTRLPALFLPRVASDPPRQALEQGVRLGSRTWSDAGNIARLADDGPEQRSTFVNHPRRRSIPGPALSRFDARGRFAVGSKRARSGRKGIHQACSEASGHAYGDPAPGTRFNPQGMVPGCHKWASAPARLAPGAGLRIRSNRWRLPCVSHRPGRLTLGIDVKPNPSLHRRTNRGSLLGKESGPWKNRRIACRACTQIASGLESSMRPCILSPPDVIGINRSPVRAKRQKGEACPNACYGTKHRLQRDRFHLRLRSKLAPASQP